MADDESVVQTESATIEHTPTWAVATVIFVLISVSILIEQGLHLLANYLSRKRRKSLLQALNRIKADLMLLGFISLILTVLERPISSICIPEGVAGSFLPCETLRHEEDGEDSKCEKQGKVSLLSRVGVQQLQMLIFFLASFHVFSSFLTLSLGALKMRSWEYWEAETRTLDYQFSNDPRRFQLIHQTSFGRRHLKFWSEHRLLRWPASFLRQFFGSVYKIDFFTLRHGFITAHFSEGTNFDFQKFIKRALEIDFGVTVGMRLWTWIFSVLFIFFNANVFRSYFWLPFIPLLMLLIVGTKLQGIITKMCLDSSNQSYVVRGTLLVRPSDHFFWFDRPKFLLHLMHFILFQNSFQLAFFTWSSIKFGLRSCFHEKTEDIVIKFAMGVVIPILCGYVTLPLYALVTQMGTSIGISVFPEGVVGGLKKWRAKARRNLATIIDETPALRSLDVSVNGSTESSNEYPSAGIGEGGFGSIQRPPERDQNSGSFGGFELSRI